jgi:hypothetical protein
LSDRVQRDAKRLRYRRVASFQICGGEKRLRVRDLGKLGGHRIVEIAVMRLAELQTTADEVSPDDDRHNDNGVRADRIDNVWGESAHGRSARLQPRPVYMTMTRAPAE